MTGLSMTTWSDPCAQGGDRQSLGVTLLAYVPDCKGSRALLAASC